MQSTFISDDQWSLIAAVLSANPTGHNLSHASRTRPAVSDRLALEGILYIIIHQCPWNKLPAAYPHYLVCYRRYITWVKNGVWEDILTTLIDDFHTRTGFDLYNDLLLESYGQSFNGSVPVIHIPEQARKDRYDCTVVILYLCNVLAMLADDASRHATA
jgi:transposase